MQCLNGKVSTAVLATESHASTRRHAQPAFSSVLPLSTLPRAHKMTQQAFCERKKRVSQQVLRAVAEATVTEQPMQLSSAETARTIVDITSHATLCTISEDGSPLGTYVTYVLDKATGVPILRLRADAVHTANLRRDSRCSCFVHAEDLPARLLGRVTLIGTVEEVDGTTASTAAAAHQERFATAMGVDAPRDSDLFFRLNVDKAFYVGGMGSNAQAEVISGDDLYKSQPDELRREAPSLVFSINNTRTEDVLRISADALGINIEKLDGAELLWVDSLGAYFSASTDDEERILRVPFPRRISDERDARSALTMLAQVAWERERKYVPIMPQFEASQA